MKHPVKPQYIPYFSLGGGGIVLLLRLWLFAFGRDERQLLSPWHPASILSLILTAAAAALILLGAMELKGNLRYQRLFPASVSGAVGTAAGALGLGWAAWQELQVIANPFATAACTAGVLAGLCLLFLAYLRFQGSHPSGWLYGIVCIYFMLHLICRYRVWSGRAQLQEYLFPMLASIALMLGCYYRAALTARLNSRMPYVICNQIAVLLCLPAIAGSDNKLFYLSMAVWMTLDLCSLKNPRKIPEPVQEEQTDDPA